MRIIILHTDFRIYWPARLKNLFNLLSVHNIKLDVLEIAGLGSPYSFSSNNKNTDISWHVLFPVDKIENLKSSEIKSAVMQKLDELNPEVIIAGAIAFASGALAVSWARKHHKRVIIFDDAKISDVRRNMIVNYVKQAVYHGVDAVLYPSPDWFETGIFWDFKSEQLFYGVDVVDNKFWQQSISFNENLPHNYFLCVGRQIPQKNFMVVLQAYKKYIDQVSQPYGLVLVGDGTEHENLIRYVRKNKLDNRVFFKPFVQQNDLISIYRQAQALIISSNQETWGLVINEAMASGLPIIASDKCGATSTLVKNKSNGFVFSPNNLSQLVNCLIQFHSLTVAEKKIMSENSIEIIKDWGTDKFANSLYQAILYVDSHSERRLTWVERTIIKLWKGRYKPI